MTEQDTMVFEGVVEESFRAGVFRVQVDDPAIDVLAHLSGKMRKARIKVLVGDRVRVEVSPYDLGKGRIVYRWK